MEWDVVQEVLDPALLVVLIACWTLGYILKQTPQVPNWAIVYVVTLFSLFFSVWILGFGALQLLQGFLCGAVAVYGYEIIKQGREGARDGQA